MLYLGLENRKHRFYFLINFCLGTKFLLLLSAKNYVHVCEVYSVNGNRAHPWEEVIQL